MTTELSKNTSSTDLVCSSAEELRSYLRICVVTIEFTKMDGSTRIINATLQQDVIVPYERKTNREKVRPENLIPVWDCDISEWRTVNFDKITKVTI